MSKSTCFGQWTVKNKYENLIRKTLWQKNTKGDGSCYVGLLLGYIVCNWSDSKSGLTDLFQYPFDQLSWILHFEVLISDYSFVLPPVYGQIKLSKSKIGKNRSSGHAKSSLNPDFLSHQL